MARRYIKDRPFNVIESRQGDSSSWKATLRHKAQISKCATLAADGLRSWIGKGANFLTKNVITTIRSENPKDELAKGIWTVKIAKVALNLWRYRAGNLPTKDRLIRCGMAINGMCELCGKEAETTDHIFLKCDYARWILKEGFEAAGSLVGMSQANNLAEAAIEINRTGSSTPAWGLQWTMFGTIVF